MRNSKWIPIEDARDLLAERSEKVLGTEWLSACSSAWKLISDSLKSGDLPSCPADPARFRFTLQSTKASETISLNADGTIPPSFWWCFSDAADKSPALVTLQSETYAKNSGGRFYFRDKGRDEGVLEGEVFSVLVPRTDLPGNLPNPRGRQDGAVSSHYNEARADQNDSVIVDQAEEAFASGRLTWKEMLQEYSPQMPGNIELSSKRVRLKRKLKARGIFGH